jgi:hypothetical protein
MALGRPSSLRATRPQAGSSVCESRSHSTVEMLQPGPNSGVCLLLAPLKYADECQECVMSAIRPNRIGRAGLLMSVDRGGPEASGIRSTWREQPTTDVLATHSLPIVKATQAIAANDLLH